MIYRGKDKLAEMLKGGLRSKDKAEDKPVQLDEDKIQELEDEIDSVGALLEKDPTNKALSTKMRSLLQDHEHMVRELAYGKKKKAVNEEILAEEILTESEVAKTILQQLGGNKFIAMTGAKNLVSGKDSIQFSIGRNSSKANKVKIVLNSKDLYDITFYNIRGVNLTELKSSKDVSVENLRKVFSSYTGLFTSLKEESEFFTESVVKTLTPKLPAWVQKMHETK